MTSGGARGRQGAEKQRGAEARAVGVGGPGQLPVAAPGCRSGRPQPPHLPAAGLCGHLGPRHPRRGAGGPQREGAPRVRACSLPVPPAASEWVPVNPRPAMVTQQTVRNLALGDKLFLRVAAVSLAGAGPPAVLAQPVHIQEAVGKARPRPRPPRHRVRWTEEQAGAVAAPHALALRPASVQPQVPGPSAARGRGRSRGHAPEGPAPSLGRGLPGPQNERARPRREEAERREGISAHGGQCPAGDLGGQLPSLLSPCL